MARNAKAKLSWADNLDIRRLAACLVKGIFTPLGRDESGLLKPLERLAMGLSMRESCGIEEKLLFLNLALLWEQFVVIR